jgi:hypothetical protein
MPSTLWLLALNEDVVRHGAYQSKTGRTVSGTLALQDERSVTHLVNSDELA